ncbi:ferrochelatase [Luteococcus sanguinis]
MIGSMCAADQTLDLSPYESVLLISFGGPEAPDEVVPFLQNVTRGSGIPVERLEQVGEHYFGFGGKSPINDQNQLLLGALTDELRARGCELPIHWGNRNWRPFIADALAEATAAGEQRLLMVTTSAYPSYSGCRQYRENLAAEPAVAEGRVSVDRIGNYALDEGFVAANAESLRAALDELPGARVVFVTHSIPTPMNDNSGPSGNAYLDWHRQVATRVLAEAGHEDDHDLVFCSRSGRPSDPWLEPDVNDHLEELKAAGIDRVVLAPIGFISDHMEVIYDLDTQARETCDRLGIQMVRAATVGTHHAFVSALVERMARRAALARGEITDPGCGGECMACPGATCCPNLRVPTKPAID